MAAGLLLASTESLSGCDQIGPRSFAGSTCGSADVHAVHGKCDDRRGRDTGVRAWVATRSPRRLTPIRLKRLTVVLMVGGVLAAGIHVGPTAEQASVSGAVSSSTDSAR